MPRLSGYSDRWRRRPRVGAVRFGSLRRVDPISREWGFDRGLPIDRYYIEQFLARSAPCVHGRVLEIESDSYTRRFGGDRVTAAEVLDVDSGNARATIVADLNDASNIDSEPFDCIVFTQTLQLIYDLGNAVRVLHHSLKPDGALLATFPGISRVSGTWAGSWYWALSPAAARRLFAGAFGSANVEVEAYGNVLAAVAFLHGVAAQELTATELDHRDAAYPVTVGVVARRGNLRDKISPRAS